MLRTFVLCGVLAGGLLGLAWTVRDPDAGVAEAAQQVEVRAESDLWLAPAAESAQLSSLGEAARVLADGQADEALDLILAARPDDVLAPYAALLQARASLAAGRFDSAVQSSRRLLERWPGGYTGESALRVLAQALEETSAWDEAAAAWQTAAGLPSGASADVQFRLGRAAEKAGARGLAQSAYSRVFHEWPASAEAREAEVALARFSVPASADTVALELGRANRLYDGRRFVDAYEAYAGVRARTTGAERQFVDRRLAQSDVQAQRYARGLRDLESYLARPAAIDRDEAGYFVLTALRGLKRGDYPARVSRFVADHPDSPFAEAAMNDLATHYILADQDGRAAEVFADMYSRWPNGRFADRAAWRAGWWAYRADNYAGTIQFFESAATTMRRADYRPAWLYWTARSYDALGQKDNARRWLVRTMADYRHSYYGRLAADAFASLDGGPPSDAMVAAERDPARAVVASRPPANASVIGRLLEAGLWDDAIEELRRIQLTDASPMIEATIAYALSRKGELRPAITAMRRAYPQFMADGGEALPARILRVIFPVAHVDIITRHAALRGLDPHLLTALVAQESTFQAEVVSSANAVGLMQLLPATGRRYAGRVGITGFTTRTLTDPEANVRMGTAYLTDLLARYGGEPAPALAAYNAGENRVDRWRAERRGVPRDEFIDDIPFPETQNYVKRILGTAADYRALYPALGVAGAAVP